MKKQNILVVDDHRENLIAMEALLEAEDRNLVMAGSGNEALALALKHDFALVLLDVQMPEMDGFEATQRIREYERRQGLVAVPIVALTAHILREHRERSLASGMNAHIPKPVEMSVLREALVRFTRKDPGAADGDAN